MNYLIYAFFALIKVSIISSKSISITSDSLLKCTQSADIDSNDARDEYITNEMRHDFCKSMHPTFESSRPVPPECLSEYCNYESFKNPCAVLCYYEATNENSLVYGLGAIETLKTESLGNNCDDKCSLYNQPGRHYTEYRFNESQKCAKNHYCDDIGCCVRQTYETETSQFTVPVTEVLTTTTTTPTTTTPPVTTTAKSDEPITQPTTTTTTTQLSTSTLQPSTLTTTEATTVQTSPLTESPITTEVSSSTTSITDSPEPSPTQTPTQTSTQSLSTPATIVTTETSSQTVITTVGAHVYSCTRVGRFADPYDESQSKYYECALIASQKHCPTAQVFDPIVSHCVDENDVSGSTETDITTTPIVEIDWHKLLSCANEGYFRNPYNCHEFYRCYFNDPNVETTLRIAFYNCGNVLVFDEKAETCDRAEDTKKCEDKPLPANMTTDVQNQSTTTTQTPSPTPTIITTLSDENSTVPLNSTEQEIIYKQFINCTIDGYFRNPFDCNRFYRCYHITEEFSVIFYKCDEGLVFEENGVNNCISSHDAKQCANRVIPLF